MTLPGALLLRLLTAMAKQRSRLWLRALCRGAGPCPVVLRLWKEHPGGTGLGWARGARDRWGGEDLATPDSQAQGPPSQPCPARHAPPNSPATSREHRDRDIDRFNICCVPTVFWSLTQTPAWRSGAAPTLDSNQRRQSQCWFGATWVGTTGNQHTGFAFPKQRVTHPPRASAWLPAHQHHKRTWWSPDYYSHRSQNRNLYLEVDRTLSWHSLGKLRQEPLASVESFWSPENSYSV